MPKKNSNAKTDETTESAFAKVVTLSAALTVALAEAIKERQAQKRDDGILRFAANAHVQTGNLINQQSANDAL